MKTILDSKVQEKLTASSKVDKEAIYTSRENSVLFKVPKLNEDLVSILTNLELKDGKDKRFKTKNKTTWLADKELNELENNLFKVDTAARVGMKHTMLLQNTLAAFKLFIVDQSGEDEEMYKKAIQ